MDWIVLNSEITVLMIRQFIPKIIVNLMTPAFNKRRTLLLFNFIKFRLHVLGRQIKVYKIEQMYAERARSSLTPQALW